MDLKDYFSILVIVGCSVWCRLLGCMVYDILLGSIVIYLCMSQSILVSKFWSGGWREIVSCVGWRLGERINSIAIVVVM